jgi:hypothetical protein
LAFGLKQFGPGKEAQCPSGRGASIDENRFVICRRHKS